MEKKGSLVPKAVIYCRVSTKEQTLNLSLTTQQKHCFDYCARQGFEVDRIFIEEGESAKTTNRPKFQTLLDYCRENKGRVQFLVVYAVNRFARNSHDHALTATWLKRIGVTLRSATEEISESSTGKLMENMLAMFAQFDNDVRSERTVAGMKTALQEGRWTFKAPIGYLNVVGQSGESAIVPDEVRAPLIAKAFELFSSGRYSKQGVLRVVTQLGLRSQKGRPITPQTFQSILSNPIYAGWVQSLGVRQKGRFLAIIEDSVWQRVQDLLNGKRSTITPHKANHPDFPLRVFTRCTTCDTPLTGSWSKGRNNKYAYYRCPKSTCRGVNVRKEQLEEKFIRLLHELRPRQKYFSLFREIVLDVWKTRQATADEQYKLATKHLDQLQRRKDLLDEAFIYKKAISKETYERQSDKLSQNIALGEIAQHEARLEQLDVEGVVAFAEHILNNASRLWLEASLDQKQRLQKALFPSGTTYDGERFGTGATCSIFEFIQPDQAKNATLASPTGFEPVLSP